MVQILDRPSSGEKFGQAFGTGLQALAQMKLQQYLQTQQENKLNLGLQALGYSPEKAKALSPLLSMSSIGSPKSSGYGYGLGPSKNIINRLIDYRKSLSGIKQPRSKNILKQLKDSGIDNQLLGSIGNNKLTDELIDFLLQQTGNDPKKAKLIAQKMGFEV